MIKENIVVDKSKSFVVRIVKLYKYLVKRNEYLMSKQLLRSGTSIGANIRESVMSHSKTEFFYKIQIALKEANESAYWLEILHETEYITNSQFESIYEDCI